jgi:SAM-dependent methyltransferase
LTNKNLKYDQKFFEGIKDGSFRSAMKIIPMVMKWTRVQSVVDVGCGAGSWLKAFQQNGVKDIFGIDGNRTGVLDIPATRFLETDLSRPFQLKRRFDLAVCVEVAEHLPADRADSLVDNLTSLAPAVLFSAAIPGQGGAHHVNEQWPEYWAEKFKKKGYLALDGLRMKTWNDPDVMWWYSQNLIFYVHKDKVRKNARLSQLPVADPPPRLVHPEHITIMALLRMIKRRLLERMGLKGK